MIRSFYFSDSRVRSNHSRRFNNQLSSDEETGDFLCHQEREDQVYD